MPDLRYIEQELANALADENGARALDRLQRLHAEVALANAQEDAHYAHQDALDTHGIEIHTIPVPHGMSVEQAWESIVRGDKLTNPHPWWANVEVVDGQFRRVLDA